MFLVCSLELEEPNQVISKKKMMGDVQMLLIFRYFTPDKQDFIVGGGLEG